MGSHCEYVALETEKPLTPRRAREVLAKASGVVLPDDPQTLVYPVPRDQSNLALC